MGCAASKIDDLEAVALCTVRTQLLEKAIGYRYDFANAHVSYLNSLRTVGYLLQNFFDQELEISSHPIPPFLNLPNDRKLGPDPDPIAVIESVPSNPVQSVHHLHSNSGSHIHFEDDDDDDDDGSGSPLSGDFSPLHQNDTIIMNRMQSRVTKAVSYELKPQISQTVQYGESSSSYDYYQNPNYFGYSYNYPSYGGINGFFGTEHHAPYSPKVSTPEVAEGLSRKAPPPPSPPRTSPWDFLNPFEGYEQAYPSYTPSRDSKDLREEEGIPDLEEENEVVKMVHGDEKLVNGSGSSKAPVEKEIKKSVDEIYRAKSAVMPVENDGREYEVYSIDRGVVPDSKKGNRNSVTVGISEAVKKIKSEFDGACNSGRDLCKLLEAGRLPYQRKNSVHHLSRRMFNVITPSLPSSTTLASSALTEEGGSLYLGFDKDMGMNSGHLSLTLGRLYIWEKKLLEEVKVEERLRVVHEQKCNRLKRLRDRGAEASKVDSTQILVKSLSTKMKTAIQVIESISDKINKLRDEELWPQTNELIEGLARMWRSMLQCHQNQCQVIKEAEYIDTFLSGKRFRDVHMEAIMQLEMEVLNWILNYFTWITAQKNYVKTLNSWLLKWLRYEPEVTADGIRPFSPSILGAPPVFVICTQWYEAFKKISEIEVLQAIQTFAITLFQIWDNIEDHSQTISMKKDAVRGSSPGGIQEMKMKVRKRLDIVNKKLILISRQCDLPEPIHLELYSPIKNISLLSSLQQIFEAMEKFTSNCMKVYEELRIQSQEEQRLARENAKVS